MPHKYLFPAFASAIALASGCSPAAAQAGCEPSFGQYQGSTTLESLPDTQIRPVPLSLQQTALDVLGERKVANLRASDLSNALESGGADTRHTYLVKFCLYGGYPSIEDEAVFDRWAKHVVLDVRTSSADGTLYSTHLALGDRNTPVGDTVFLVDTWSEVDDLVSDSAVAE